jgi:hypothetical protein
MVNPAPLILTLQLDEHSFAFFNKLRKQHFPANINYLDAHVTLFHHLPHIPQVTDLLEAATARQATFPLAVTGLMKLGRGVAYQIQSADLINLHNILKNQWLDWLKPQDRQGLRPHITVQNKVQPETAQALYTQLNASFRPFNATGVGLSLWEYQGGPWRKLQDYSFLTSS